MSTQQNLYYWNEYKIESARAVYVVGWCMLCTRVVVYQVQKLYNVSEKPNYALTII